ncbi:MAG: hypothetical protein RIT18_421, partial [Actinomycetota bacterium]
RRNDCDFATNITASPYLLRSRIEAISTNDGISSLSHRARKVVAKAYFYSIELTME